MSACRFWDRSQRVGALVVIVGKACEREVAGDGLTTVLLSDHMINLHGKLVVDLRHLAVFTTVASSLPDELAESDLHSRSSVPLGMPQHLPSF